MIIHEKCADVVAVSATHGAHRATFLRLLHDIPLLKMNQVPKFLFRRFSFPLSGPGASLILGDMGYAEKLQKLCALRGMDQSALAARVGVSRSSMSRILSGAREPKLKVAYQIARALDVTLDYLVDDSLELDPEGQLIVVSDDEAAILKMVRRLGVDAAIDRLLRVGSPPEGRAGNGDRGDEERRQDSGDPVDRS